jgi:NAD(P)-dependent dehydrogenase (short-subunit alcohol dehydrogenase family)
MSQEDETMSALFDLRGRVAVVTGGSRGIGKAIASAYADAGAALVLAGRNAEPLDHVVEGLRSQGVEAIGVPTHSGRVEELERLLKAASERFGGIDILVNNAATNPYFGPLSGADERAWTKTLEVNLLGYAHASRLAVKSMTSRGGGKIVNVTSIAAERPLPGLGVYGASKAAVSAMTRALALELAPVNIQVNALAPGIIRTRFSRALWEGPPDGSPRPIEIPAGRFGEPEVAEGARGYPAVSGTARALLATPDCAHRGPLGRCSWPGVCSEFGDAAEPGRAIRIRGTRTGFCRLPRSHMPDARRCRGGRPPRGSKCRQYRG